MASAELSSFLDYEREFLSLSSTLPPRINSLSSVEAESEAAPELRRVEADLTTARQRLQDMEMEVRLVNERAGGRGHCCRRRSVKH
jgi:hypothetical protein